MDELVQCLDFKKFLRPQYGLPLRFVGTDAEDSVLLIFIPPLPPALEVIESSDLRGGPPHPIIPGTTTGTHVLVLQAGPPKGVNTPLGHMTEAKHSGVCSVDVTI